MRTSPDALRAVAHGELDLLGEVDVGEQVDDPPIGRDAGLGGESFELEIELPAAADLGARLPQVGGTRIEQHGPARAVDEEHGPVPDPAQRSGHAHHRGNAERVGENRGVRSPGALLAHQSGEAVPVELDREARARARAPR